MAIQSQHVDHRQPAALADFVIVEVVRRGDLHAASALFHIGVFVGDDGDATTDQRQLNELADQALVAFVFRVHRYTGVAEQGFRTGGTDHDVVFTGRGFHAIGQWVAQVPHLAFDFAVLHFQVGNRGVQFRVPVDQALATVDQLVVVQADEHFLYRTVETGIHGETFGWPVYGVAQTTHLAGDGAAGLFLPFPDLLDKGVTAQIVAGQFFFGGQLALNHHLGGYAGVVGTHLPQGVAALHAAVAGQRVHDGVLEGVAHVQAAGDVGRRNHDAVGVAFTGGCEVTLLFPGLVPGFLDIVGLVGLVHWGPYL